MLVRLYLEKLPGPVSPVADEPQVREGPLGSAHLVLNLAELITDGDQELAVALALIGRQGEDTRQVVTFFAVLLFGEVPVHVEVGRDFSNSPALKCSAWCAG